jgi:hypothetical protein
LPPIHCNALLDDPRRHAKEIGEFLDDRPALQAMARALEPGLYRNRNTATEV